MALIRIPHCRSSPSLRAPLVAAALAASALLAVLPGAAQPLSPGSAEAGSPGFCAPTRRFCTEGRTSRGFDSFASSCAGTGEAPASRHAATSTRTCDL